MERTKMRIAASVSDSPAAATGWAVTALALAK
jgi:hypothetical protein